MSDVATKQVPALQAWVRLLRGHAAAARSLSARLVAEHGLTINDYEALLLLSQAEGKYLRRVDLAHGLQLTASGITRLLDGLEQAGHVTRAICQSDARVTYAVITEAGEAKLAEASCSHVHAIRELFEDRFSDDELETLARLLGRLPGASSTESEDCLPPVGP
jgi:DNA-binding MarR family transcriptional regulator